MPHAITRGLRRRGVDVLTAQEYGATELDDPALLDRAGALGRILFTRDQDLLAEAAQRLRAGRAFASVIFARQLDVSIGRCIADLEVIAKAGSAKEPPINREENVRGPASASLRLGCDSQANRRSKRALARVE